MAENESIGGISVEIVGDYSKLQGDIDSAAQVAQKGGEEIASALNTGAAGADALSSAVATAAAGVGDFDARIEALVASGSTLAEALGKVQAETADMAGATGAAAGAIDEFGASADQTATETEKARTALQEFLSATQEVTPAEHEAASGLSDWHEKLIAFAEALVITDGLKEFGLAALEASDNITRASISLTALSGSGEKAKVTIEEIEALGIQDGLSLPGLLQASTRMTALLPAGSNVVELLTHIADGAAVMGKDIGASADAFDRLVTMGSLAARQLLPLGLNLDQVAKAMNDLTGSSDATATNVSKMFKALDPGDRIEVLSTALEHLSGIAQQAAEQTFGGQWQILANQWEQVMREVGDALIPVITGLTDLMKVDVLPFLKSLAESFNELPTPVKEMVVALGLAAAAIVPVTLALGGLTFAVDAAMGALAPLVAIVGGPLLAVVGVGLVSALAAVTFGFHDLNVAMAGTAQSAADLDVKFQAHMVALAGAAHSEADVAAAEDKIKAALDAGAISKETATKLLNELADAEKKIVGTEFAAWSSSLGASIHLVTEELTPAQAAAEGFRVKMQTLGQAVTDTRDRLVAVTAAYNDHKASAADVAKAYDAWQGATNALKGSQDALLPVITNAVVAQKAFNVASLDAVSAQQGIADKLAATNLLIGQQGISLDHAKTILHDVMDEYSKGQATLQDVSKALNEVNAAQKAIDATWAAEPPIASAMQVLATDTQAAAVALAGLVTQAQLLPGPLGDAYAILDKMHVKLGENSRDVEQLGKDYVELGTVPHTLDMMDAAWTKVSGSLNKIATVDLPLAIQMENTHIAAMQQAGAAQGALYDEEEKALQLEIRAAEQRGEDANAQVVQLNNVRLLQKALTDDATLLGDTEVKAVNDVIQIFTHMGSAIAQVIVEGGNMGQVFVDTAKKMAEAVLTDFINGALQKLVDMIVKVVIPNIYGQVAPVVSTTAAINAMQAAMHTATVAMSADIGALTAQFNALAASIAGSGAGGVGGGAGGAGAGAAGGAMGMAGAIGSIVGALASIYGDIQMSHLISTAGKIEENTRSMDIVFEKYAQTDEWDRHTGILAKFDMLFDRLGDIWNEVTTAWENIVSALGVAGTLPTGTSPSTASPSTAAPAGTSPSTASPSTAAPAGTSPSTASPATSALSTPVTIPSLPSVSSPSTSQGGISTTGGGNIGSINITVNAASDPRETARQLANTLRTLSSKFSAYGQ